MDNNDNRAVHMIPISRLIFNVALNAFALMFEGLRERSEEESNCGRVAKALFQQVRNVTAPPSLRIDPTTKNPFGPRTLRNCIQHGGITFEGENVILTNIHEGKLVFKATCNSNELIYGYVLDCLDVILYANIDRPPDVENMPKKEVQDCVKELYGMYSFESIPHCVYFVRNGTVIPYPARSY